MKRWRRAAEVIIVVCSFLIFSSRLRKKGNTQEEAKELQIKKIGVAVYNNDDQEVQAFRN